MGLVWREQMSVANNLIDSEHKYLIDQINALETALNTKENHDIVDETLDHLVSYTKTHFDHEETIQRKIRYPQLDEHKLEHKQIMRNLYAIKNELDSILGIDQRDRESDNNDEVTDSELNMILADEEVEHSVTKQDLEPLIALIRSWIIDHVIGSDMKLKAYLIKRPVDFV